MQNVNVIIQTSIERILKALKDTLKKCNLIKGENRMTDETQKLVVEAEQSPAVEMTPEQIAMERNTRVRKCIAEIQQVLQTHQCKLEVERNIIVVPQ